MSFVHGVNISQAACQFEMGDSRCDIKYRGFTVQKDLVDMEYVLVSRCDLEARPLNALTLSCPR